MRKTVAFLVGASLVSANVAFAGALAPKKPSQVVTLSFSDSGVTTNCSFGTEASFQLTSDGTFSPFAGIPAGQVLMVTGMQVYSFAAPASHVAKFEMRIQSAGAAAVAATAGCLADAAGNCSNSVSFLTGIPVGSGVTLCVDGDATTYSVTMQGYLTKDK